MAWDHNLVAVQREVANLILGRIGMRTYKLAGIQVRRDQLNDLLQSDLGTRTTLQAYDRDHNRLAGVGAQLCEYGICLRLGARMAVMPLVPDLWPGGTHPSFTMTPFVVVENPRRLTVFETAGLTASEVVALNKKLEMKHSVEPHDDGDYLKGKFEPSFGGEAQKKFVQETIRSFSDAIRFSDAISGDVAKDPSIEIKDPLVYREPGQDADGRVNGRYL